MKGPVALILGLLCGAGATLGVLALAAGDGSPHSATAPHAGSQEAVLAVQDPRERDGASSASAGANLLEAAPAPEDAPPAAALQPLDDRVGIVVHGTVRDAAGGAIDMRHREHEWLGFTADSGDERNSSIDDEGRFALSGLQAGTWRVRLTLSGFRPLVEQLELTETQRVVTHDLLVERAVVLEVRGYTPEGRPLLEVAQEKLPEAIWSFRLAAVATAEEPGSLLPAIGHRSYSGYGIGCYYDRWEGMEASADLAPDAMGLLELYQSPPAFASLVLRHVVLQTLPVEPGATSITFVVPWERIDAQFGDVRVRVVDAQTLRALPDAVAELSDSQSMGGGDKPNADGVFSWEHQRPGLLDLTLSCKGYERWSTRVNVPPGGVADLGTVALDAATHIAGTVRDEQGQPRVATLVLVPLDRADETGATMWRYSWTSDASGRFSIEGLGRREYEIRVSGGDWTGRPVLVSTRGGAVDNAVVIVASGTLVAFDARWSPLRSCALHVSARDGALAFQQESFPGAATIRKRLLPGDYEARLLGGDRLLTTVPFTVAGERMLVPLSLP